MDDELKKALDDLRKITAATNDLKRDIHELMHHALIAASLGSSFMFSGEAKRDNLKGPASVVIVLSGDIPQDLIDGLLEHVRGLIQDYQLSIPKESFTVMEDNTKKPKHDEP
jgi:hypothetical protein